MKKLLVLALLALMVSGAIAQDLDNVNSMGIFFSDDVAAIVAADDAANAESEALNEFTNTNDFGTITGYIVLLYPSVDSVGGYECSIEIDNGDVFIQEATGPQGWTNFGSVYDHQCGYFTPVPVVNGGVVLSTLTMRNYSMDRGNISMGASDLQSIAGVMPVIVDGADADILIQCQLVCAGEDGGDHIVATTNGPGVVPAEPMSFSGVKALFQ